MYPLMTSSAAIRAGVRFFASQAKAGKQVAVLGAAGGIGQPLSLLLKLNKDISQLSLYDVVNTPGVAADLSHINTNATVKGYKGQGELGEALKGSDIVVIPAGVPRKPGMTRDDLFNTNASIVATLAHACAKHCPQAHILIISNPVNSTVPIAAHILQQAGVYNPKRVYGVTTLDVVRANRFITEVNGGDPAKTDVTVIGGHAGITILPLLSKFKLSQEQIEKLTHRIQFGGDEVVKAKDGAGSATLSMAFAANRFVNSLINGLNGASGVSECAFVQSEAVKDVPFFATRVDLTTEGVGKVHGTGDLSPFEQKCLEAMLPELRGSIKKGIEFAKAWKPQ